MIKIINYIILYYERKGIILVENKTIILIKIFHVVNIIDNSS